MREQLVYVAIELRGDNEIIFIFIFIHVLYRWKFCINPLRVRVRYIGIHWSWKITLNLYEDLVEVYIWMYFIVKHAFFHGPYCHLLVLILVFLHIYG